MRRCATVLFALLVLAPEVGRAQERTIADALSVPDGAVCLRGPELAMHVRAWLRRDSVADAVSVLVVDERGDERRDVAFVLLHGEDALARRSFPLLPEGCTDRRAAVALAIAIAIDSGVLEGLSVPEPAPVDEQQPTTAVAEETEAPLTRDDEASPWHLGLGVHAGGMIGVLPDPALHAGGAVELRYYDRWALRLGGSGTTTTDVALGGGGVRTQLVFGRADACLLLGLGAVAMEGCTTFAGGVLFAEGRDYDQPQSANLKWLAGGLRLGGRFPANGDIALRLGLDGWLSLLRPRMQVYDPTGVVRSQRTLPAAGISGDLGVVVTFL